MPGLAQDAPVNRFSGIRLISQYPGHHRKLNANIGPSLTLARGTVLGLTVGSTNDVQTINLGGTPTGGAFTVTVNPAGNPLTTGLINYNCSAAGIETGNGTVATPYVSLQGALVALLGSGNVGVTGSAQPGNTQTITFKGNLAALPIPVITATITGLTGGSPTVTIAHSTTGVTGGTYVPYSTAQIAAPSAAATATTNTGTASPPPAAPYIIGYTYVNAVGETTLSPTVEKTADGTHDIIFASIAFPTGATAINYYVNGYYVGQNTVAGTFVVNLANLTAQTPPLDNTTCPAVAILEYDVATDTAGNVFFGLQAGSEWGQSFLTAPCYENGEFLASELVGLDVNALRQLRGRQIGGTYATSGAITTGIVHIP